MADLGLTGLASGVDTDGIVSRLMALERQGVTRLQRRDKAVEGRQTALRDVQTKLKNLRGAAEALRAPALWGNTQTVDSSDPSRIAVQRTGMIPAGGYAIQVRQLAAAEREGFTFAKSDAATELMVGAIKVDIAAGATPADVATLINNRSDLTVYATALDDDTIVFSARKTGTDGAFDVSGSQLTADPTHTKGALNAEYSLDGGATWPSSSTATLDGVLPGLKITLKSVTQTPVTINAGVAGLDQAAVKDKIKAFVNAYNDLVGTTRTKLDEKSVVNPTTDSQAARGQLFGDSGLTSMLDRMRRSITDEVEGMATSPAMNELSEIGISTGKARSATTNDAKMGKLVIDDEVLTAALADPAKVRALLGGSETTTGFTQRLEALIDKEAGTGGVLEERLKVATAERKRLTEQNAAIERRLTAKEKRLRDQFAAMEAAMGQAQSQQGWLTAQLSSITRY